MFYEFKRRMCEMEFDRYSYDFIHTDSATFAFLEHRFYISFDSLFVGDSKQVLERFVEEERYGETFLLTIENGSGEPTTMACQILPPNFPDAVRLRMMQLDDLIDSCGKNYLDNRINDILIQQYSDLIFFYDAHSRKVTFHRNGIEDGGSNVLFIDEFEQMVNAKIKDSCRAEFAKFMSDIRSGVRAFSANVEIAESGESLTLTGIAVYDGFDHRKTVGRFGPSCASTSLVDLIDPPTGVFTKERITDYAKSCINEKFKRTGIAIVDLDDFKQVNDNFGHSKGDEVIRRVADILTECVGNLGKVGRIGGDEFLIVYDNFDNIKDIRYSFMGMGSLTTTAYSPEQDGFCTSLSIGCAVYPDDYKGSFEDMFKLADAFLYRAKDKGKNRYIVYNEEKHGPIEDILKFGFKKSIFDKSELVCELLNSYVKGENMSLDEVLEKISHYFSVERVVLYNKSERYIMYQVGQKRLNIGQIRRTIGYIYDEVLAKEYENGFFTTNNTEYFEGRAPETYKKLMEQSNYAFQHFLFKGKSGKEYVLSLDSVNARTTWNLGDVQNYRIIVKILESML